MHRKILAFYVKNAILQSNHQEELMATTNLSIRIDSETKKQAEQLFGNLGMSISTAFNIFVKQLTLQKKAALLKSLKKKKAKENLILNFILRR